MRDFLTQSMTREGAESMITPREIIRDYVTLLDLCFSNPDRTFDEILGKVQRSEAPADADGEGDGAPALPTPKPAVTLDDIEF